MIIVEIIELATAPTAAPPLYFGRKREFDDTDSAVTFVKRFRERAHPSERATAYKLIEGTYYRMPC